MLKWATVYANLATYLLKILEWVNRIAKILLLDEVFCGNRSCGLFYAASSGQLVHEKQRRFFSFTPLILAMNHVLLSVCGKSPIESCVHWPRTAYMNLILFSHMQNINMLNSKLKKKISLMCSFPCGPNSARPPLAELSLKSMGAPFT